MSERAWGTVREDYSADGNAWDFFPHDHARSRAYRWNEDGLAGICDEHQLLCFALAFWNGRDAILKERAFGLSGPQGNHGEDVKEYWWYLDSTPTHSWMRWRYMYPQAEFPYERLVEENRRRGKDDPEFELLDTGVFDDGRYWEITVDYAKATPEDLLIRITARNAGPGRRPPSTSCRRCGFATPGRGRPTRRRPQITLAGEDARGASTPSWARARWSRSGEPGAAVLRQRDQSRRGCSATRGAESTPYPKDGINDHVVARGRRPSTRRSRGTKAARHHRLTVPAGESATIELRLRRPRTADRRRRRLRRRS